MHTMMELPGTVRNRKKSWRSRLNGVIHFCFGLKWNTDTSNASLNRVISFRAKDTSTGVQYTSPRLAPDLLLIRRNYGHTIILQSLSLPP